MKTMLMLLAALVLPTIANATALQGSWQPGAGGDPATAFAMVQCAGDSALPPCNVYDRDRMCGGGKCWVPIASWQASAICTGCPAVGCCRIEMSVLDPPPTVTVPLTMSVVASSAAGARSDDDISKWPAHPVDTVFVTGPTLPPGATTTSVAPVPTTSTSLPPPTTSTTRQPTTSTAPVPSTTSTTVPQSQALLASYGFEEASGTQLVDSSGNNRHGSLGGATRTVGDHGGALNTTNGSATAPSPGQVRTVMAWVRPTSNSGWRCAVSNRGTQSYAPHWFLCTNNGQVAGGHWTTQWVDTQGGPTVPLNQWTHLAMTFNGTTMFLYRNGSQVASLSSALPGGVDNGIRFGETVPVERWRGLVDEVRLYDRTLTAAEIQADMATPIAPPVPTTTTAPISSTTSTSRLTTTTAQPTTSSTTSTTSSSSTTSTEEPTTTSTTSTSSTTVPDVSDLTVIEVERESDGTLRVPDLPPGKRLYILIEP